MFLAQTFRLSVCVYAENKGGILAKKFEANVKRDYVVRMELQDKGIKCLIVWECTVKKMMKNRESRETYLVTVTNFLKNDNLLLEI